MDIHERIKLIRQHYQLTRKEFGNILGVSENVIVNIEFNRLKKPAHKEPLLRLICEKFNINESWLRSGEGSMFSDKDKNVLEDLTEQYHLSELEQKILTVYLSLSQKNRDVIMDFVQQITKEPDPQRDILEFAAQTGVHPIIRETPEQKEARRAETLRDLEEIPDYSFDDDID